MKSLVTGATGQDGSYLCELLLSKGYQVVGLIRRTSTSNFDRIKHLIGNPNFSLIEGELSDTLSMYSIIENGKFDEIYNLAAMSHVGTSFKQPVYTIDVNLKGVLNILEAIHKYSPKTKLYQASTSEMFGKSNEIQNENTRFAPQSPYAIAKLAAHNMVSIYRQAYGLHASCGILFNHDSSRRGEEFVTRKITRWLGKFNAWMTYTSPHRPGYFLLEDPDYIYDLDGKSFPKLRLGNLDSFRDFGHAQNYVQAMYLMLQQESPDDYVIASGKTHSIREFLAAAFREIGISDYMSYVVIDPKFYRPAEVDFLHGDPSKAKEKLGWTPTISFNELVSLMVDSDIELARSEAFSGK